MKLTLVLVSLFAQCILATVLVPPEWQSIDAPVNPDLQVRVVFSLHQDNLDELERLFWERSDPTNEKYAQYFTQQELGDIVAPGGHRESNVIGWMKANNFTDAQIETVNTRDVVYLHGSVQQIARLLKVKFEYFQHAEVKERTILRSLTKAFIPFHLRSDIQLIHGINDFPPLFRRAKNRQTGNVEMPQHKIQSGESSATCEFTITSVNARSQTAGPTIIVNISYNCSATPCTSFTVAAASANPNINYNISMTFPAVQVCTNNVCTIPMTVAYYIPLNVSATAYCGSNFGPVQYTYPVLVDPHVVPQTLWSLYNMGKNPIVTHPNATQAVVEFEQQYYSPNDLTQFLVLMGLPLSAPVTVIGPNDVTNPGAEAIVVLLS